MFRSGVAAHGVAGGPGHHDFWPEMKETCRLWTLLHNKKTPKVYILYIYILIGGIPTPLKNMSSSDWIIIPTIGENKSHVPNTNQYIYII